MPSSGSLSLEERLTRLEVENAELRAEVSELRAANLELRADNARLTAENVALKERLGLDSSNSHLPPSLDPPGQERPGKRRSPRTRGGQAGHAGHGRKLLPESEVDEIIELRPANCRRCGESLPESLNALGQPRRFQVAELPERLVHVSEYRLAQLRCPCCKTKTRAELPAGVGTSLLGPRLEAAVAVLTFDARLSRRLVQGISKDILGLPLSVGTIDAALQRTGAAVAAPVQEIAAALAEAPAVHADETSWLGTGPNDWLWLAANERLALFRVLRGRGKEQARELLGADYAGCLTSDRYSSYGFVPQERRQFCHAHLRRDWRRVSERDGPAREIGEQMVDLCDELFACVRARRGEGEDLAWLQELLEPTRADYDELLRRGAREGDKKTAALCRSLLRNFGSLWVFSEIEGVEPTNNHAERCLRPAVIKRKLSFGNQSEQGERTLERLLSVTQTCRLQSRSCFDYLCAAIASHRLGQPAPSLV